MKNLSLSFLARRLCRTALLPVLVVGFSTLVVQAQTVTQDFDGDIANDETVLGYVGTASFSNGTATLPVTNTGSAFHTSGNSSWGISNGTQTLVFRQRTFAATSANNYMQFRLAAWGLTPSEGLDATDEVNVYISTDGGQTYTHTLQVIGKNNGGGNGFWDFTVGPQNIINYSPEAPPVTLGPSSSDSNQNGGGFDNFRINLPDGALNVQFYIEAKNDVNELWTIDDVTLGSSEPLPVELTSFKATSQGSTIKIQWSTASEKNSHYFDIQRSQDGKVFRKLGTVDAHGTTTIAHSYSFIDHNPVAGTAYYRLRQVDADGTAAYSPVAVVQTIGLLEAGVYPNPSKAQITLPAISGLISYRVYTTQGQTLLTGQAEGGSRIDLRSVPTGIYLLELTSGAARKVQRLARE